MSSMDSPRDIAMEVDEMPNSVIQMTIGGEDEEMDIDTIDQMPNSAIQATTGGENEQMDIDTLIQMFRRLILDDEMKWD